MDRPRVKGIGGIFFKARDPAALGAWYRDRLGMPIEAWGGAIFREGAEGGGAGYTVWSPFEASTGHFAPSDKPFMVNLRVDDLDAMLASLRAGGVEVLDRREDTPQGRFGYVLDPEGTLLELWEPAAGGPSPPPEC